MNKHGRLAVNGGSLLAVLLVGLTACGGGVLPGGYQPFVGTKDAHYTPVEGINYINEDILSFNVNGGCGPNTKSIARKDVGRERFGGGSQCGGFLLPKKWHPGLTAKVIWQVDPYPDWQVRREPGGGMVMNKEETAKHRAYYESHSVTVPLPPYDKVYEVTVHFLDCNQIYIDYGGTRKQILQATKNIFALFDKSQQYCSKRPHPITMQDYKKMRPQMDKIREERRHIPQYILPEYVKQATEKWQQQQQSAK